MSSMNCLDHNQPMLVKFSGPGLATSKEGDRSGTEYDDTNAIRGAPALILRDGCLLANRPLGGWRSDIRGSFKMGYSSAGSGIDGLQTYDVLGAPITVTSPVHAAETIEHWAADEIGRFVCIRDVASLVMISEDPALRDLHKEAAMITPDGSPIALVGRLRGLPVRRTCGPDLFDLICRRSVSMGLSHFFYGGKEGVAAKLAQTMTARYPGLKIAGYECPPFRPATPDEDAAAVERIKRSGADIIWVGISSPKQDVWMYEHYRSLPQTLIGVGAAFDFHTGQVKRAPRWMQKLMLEWLYRLASEPRRLWRRYLVLAPRFIWKVALSSLAPRTQA